MGENLRPLLPLPRRVEPARFGWSRADRRPRPRRAHGRKPDLPPLPRAEHLHPSPPPGGQLSRRPKDTDQPDPDRFAAGIHTAHETTRRHVTPVETSIDHGICGTGKRPGAWTPASGDEQVRFAVSAAVCRVACDCLARAPTGASLVRLFHLGPWRKAGRGETTFTFEISSISLAAVSTGAHPSAVGTGTCCYGWERG